MCVSLISHHVPGHLDVSRHCSVLPQLSAGRTGVQDADHRRRERQRSEAGLQGPIAVTEAL